MGAVVHFPPGFRVERCVGDRRAWEEALRSFHEQAATVLKDAGSTVVWRAELLGRAVVVKRWECRTLGDRLKALFGHARGHRHWAGARWLADHGIATAEPLALAYELGRRSPRIWLVMSDLAGPTVLEILGDASVPVRHQHALADALGRQVAAIVAHGRYNRDHKPSNLIVTRRDDTGAQVAVIDCVAINRCGRGSDLAARRMLASLIIEPHGVGRPPRRALMMRGLRAYLGAERTRPVTRIVWGLVGRMYRAHGDPTPRIDPLARK